MARITFTTIILFLFQLSYSQDYRDRYTGIYVKFSLPDTIHCSPFNYETPDTFKVEKHDSIRVWFYYFDGRPAGGCTLNQNGTFGSQASGGRCTLDSYVYETGRFKKQSDSLIHLFINEPYCISYIPPRHYFWDYFEYLKVAELPVSVSPLTYRSLKLYPQPAQNELFVSEMPQGKKTMYLHDLLGKVVWHKESLLESEKIDLSALQKGMYILVVEAEGKRFTEKVLKE